MDITKTERHGHEIMRRALGLHQSVGDDLAPLVAAVEAVLAEIAGCPNMRRGAAWALVEARERDGAEGLAGAMALARSVAAHYGDTI